MKPPSTLPPASAFLLWGIFALHTHAVALATEGDAAWPLTVAEKSGYQATSSSGKVVQFLERLDAGADHLQTIEFGRTVEDRPLQCVVAAHPVVSEPQQLIDDPRTVVLVLGNIHSGECAGKEAMLMLLRELADQPAHPWFEHLVLLLVPNYNADGNDKVSRDNRPGQIGPAKGMGQRANAQGLDLNRDYMKLDSPESRALVGLVNRWDPHVFVDMHTTNGSWHRYWLTYDVPHNPASPAALRSYMRRQMMPQITRALERKGIPTFYYGNFDRDHTRWTTFGDLPRFGTEYLGLRGRVSILAEAYAYIPYRQRIVASREFLRETLQVVASRGPKIRQLLDDIRSGAQAKQDAVADLVAVRSQVTALDTPVVVRGYAPAGQPRDGRLRPTEPRDYQVDFYTKFEPTVVVQRPAAYLIPESQQDVVERLRCHGIKIEQTGSKATRQIEVYRIVTVSRRERPYQNRHLLDLNVEPHTVSREIPQGTWVVRTDQPLSNLIVLLLEPASSDGMAAWNILQGELIAGSEYPIYRLARFCDKAKMKTEIRSTNSETTPER